MEINLNKQGLEGVLDLEQYCKDNNIDVKEVIKLNCKCNKLTEIKGLDKLVNLENLLCGFNELIEIKGLDKLVNLRRLDCYSNQLTELDLSKLVNLEMLYCSFNKLTELDLSKLVNLECLSCHNNKLTKLKGLNKLVNLEWLNGKEYIKPEPDKLNLILSKIEKLEQDIAEIKTKI